MSLTVSEGASGTYTPPEAGTFAARCVAVIDLGTQTSTYEGETKAAHKLLMQFEVCDNDNRRDDGSPHIVSKRFTASLHAKAALRGFLEAWRGRPFTPDELRGFDLKTLLDVPCLLGIVHSDKGDRTYANISSVMRLPKGMPAPVGVQHLTWFDLSAPDWESFSMLPQRLQDQITASPEYQRGKQVPARVSVTGNPPSATPAPRPPAPSPAPAAPPAAPAGAVGSGVDDMADDIPF